MARSGRAHVPSILYISRISRVEIRKIARERLGSSRSEDGRFRESSPTVFAVNIRRRGFRGARAYNLDSVLLKASAR